MLAFYRKRFGTSLHEALAEPAAKANLTVARATAHSRKISVTHVIKLGFAPNSYPLGQYDFFSW
jgi:hypothetical protein